MSDPDPTTLQRFEGNARRFKRAGRFRNLRHLLRCWLPPELIDLVYDFCKETAAKAAVLPGIRSAIATGHAAAYARCSSIHIIEPGFQHIETICWMNIEIVNIQYEYVEVTYAPFVRDDEDEYTDPPDELYPSSVVIVDGASDSAQYVQTYELRVFSQSRRPEHDRPDPNFKSSRRKVVPFMVAPSGELMLGSANYSGLRRCAAQFPLEAASIFNQKWHLYNKYQSLLYISREPYPEYHSE